MSGPGGEPDFVILRRSSEYEILKGHSVQKLPDGSPVAIYTSIGVLDAPVEVVMAMIEGMRTHIPGGAS